MEKQIKEIIRSVVREEFISELSKNDIHVKQIMKFYDNGTYSTKKAVSIFVSGKTNASRNQILDDLADMGYDDAWEVMDHFKLKLESTQMNEGFGDTIKKIRNLAVKMASTKFDRAKSHMNLDKIASSDGFDGKDAMNKATTALLQQTEMNEDLKGVINKIAVKLGTGATMMSVITALLSMSGWIQYLDSSFTKWYYTEIQKLAEPQVMQVMQDLGRAGQEEGSIYGKLGMYAFFIFFTIAVISLVAARMTQKPKNEGDVVPGGLAKGLSLNDIAEKHGVSVDMMVGEFKKGIQIEMEHTTDREVAKEITLDHLFEDPKYYDKLAKVEEYIDDKGVERVGAALPQTEEDPIKEGLLKEDIATQLIFSLILIAQAAMIGGSLAKMSSIGSGYNLGPIDSIKKWWNDKKTDNVVKSIVNKIKTDPELIDFLKLPASQQRGKFRNMVATKLSSDELKYLNRINKSDVRQNESMNEDSSFFSKLKKGINVVGKFPPYKEFIVVSTDGKKSASLKDLKTGKTIDIYSTNNYKLKESVNESTDCGCGCE